MFFFLLFFRCLDFFWKKYKTNKIFLLNFQCIKRNYEGFQLFQIFTLSYIQIINAIYLKSRDVWGWKSIDKKPYIKKQRHLLTWLYKKIHTKILWKGPSQNLSEFMRINFYSPWNHQIIYGFLLISGRIDVN